MASDLPGYTATVERNGSPVEFVEAVFARTADNVAPSWSIKLPYPINIADTDTWTIKRGYGGMEQTLVDQELATSITGSESPRDYSRVVSGQGETTELLEYCVPKTLVYVNQTWLQSVCPNWQLRDNIIKQGLFQNALHEENFERFYHPRLPGKDVGDDEFICIIGPASHHAIARHLAGLVGYNIVVNTPDLDLINTYTVPVGTTWFDAIKTNFMIWGPNVQLLDDTLYILDMMPSAADPVAVQTITVDKPAILSISESDSDVGREKTVDHVIVKGRTSTNTSSYYAQPQEFSIIKLPEIPLEENDEIGYVEQSKYVEERKKLGSYTGEFESGDYIFSVSGIEQTTHQEFYHVYEVGFQQIKKRKLVREIVEHYEIDGTLKARTTTYYRYGPNKRPIGSSTHEEGLVRYPGEEDRVWVTLKWHHIFQDSFAKGINRSLTSELVEGLVLYEENDQGEKLSPMALADANRLDKSRSLIDKNASTNQAVLEMTMNTRITKIDRLDDDTLIQRIFDYDVLADDVKSTRQIIENPQRDEIESNSTEEVFTAEFHEGSGQMIGSYGPCYHPPRTVSHEDIDTEAKAEAVADRVFARKGTRNTTITFKSPIPIPFTTMSCLISLPSRAYTVDGSPITITGGSYILRAVSERITPDGTEQTIEVRSEF